MHPYSLVQREWRSKCFAVLCSHIYFITQIWPLPELRILNWLLFTFLSYLSFHHGTQGSGHEIIRSSLKMSQALAHLGQYCQQNHMATSPIELLKSAPVQLLAQIQGPHPQGWLGWLKGLGSGSSGKGWPLPLSSLSTYGSAPICLQSVFPLPSSTLHASLPGTGLEEAWEGQRTSVHWPACLPSRHRCAWHHVCNTLGPLKGLVWAQWAHRVALRGCYQK